MASGRTEYEGLRDGGYKAASDDEVSADKPSTEMPKEKTSDPELALTEQMTVHEGQAKFARLGWVSSWQYPR